MNRQEATSPTSKKIDFYSENRIDKPKITSIPHYSEKYKDIIAKAVLTKNYLAEYQGKSKKEHSPAAAKEHSYFFFRVRSIGVGAHSFVYLVQEEKSKMLLAEKSITKQHSRQIEKDLIRQIKLLLYLSHDNIIKLYHIYATESHLNLVMEFAEDSLFALKQKFGIFKEKEVIEIIRQLLLALEYLHSQQIVHADVKLQNIMIANGTIKLCDFGLAHRYGKPLIEQNILDKSQQVVGTLQYLPPEYAKGVDSGPARDIWAVGILAYEMALGRHPFEGLKQNEKWGKLVNNLPSDYLQEIYQGEKNLGLHLEKFIELQKAIFLPWGERWSAHKLLSLPFFNAN